MGISKEIFRFSQKKTFRRLALIGVLSACLLPFQNCSLYQSEGKKFLDENGASLIADNENSSSNNSFSGAVAGGTTLSHNNCSPYLSREKASEIMQEQDLSIELLSDEVSNRLLCMISSNTSEQDDGPDTVVCTISEADHQLLFLPQEDKLADPHPSGELDGGSFGFTSVKEDGSTNLHFLGAKNLANQAAHCIISFESQNSYDEHSQEAINRASDIVHEMVQSI